MNAYCLPKVYIYNRNTEDTAVKEILKIEWQFGKTKQWYANCGCYIVSFV